MDSLLYVSTGANETALPKSSAKLEVRRITGKEAAHLSSTVARLLERAIAESRADRIVIVNGDVITSPAEISKALKGINTESGATLYPVQIGDSIISLDELSAECGLKTLTSSSLFPVGAITVEHALIDPTVIDGCTTTSEALGVLLAQSLGELEVGLSTEEPLLGERSGVTLNASARANCIRALIDAAPIEDLFPSLPWHAQGKESAMKVYHTLAATFLKLGDTEASLECLQLSDQLEDSPRSLALKGLIAKDRGEVLGAVANMVSSLQQYEQKKKSLETTITIASESLEVINENLHAGLAALNKRDNETALTHFKQAVFTFDPFFTETGVDKEQ